MGSKATTTELLLKAVGASEPTGDPAHKKLGDLPLEKIVEVALEKRADLLSKSLKAAVKSVLGSARSLGITVNGKDPKVVSKEIDEGAHDELLRSYESAWRGG